MSETPVLKKHTLPGGTVINEMNRAMYAHRVAFAMRLALKDWPDHPDHLLWENRYINLIVGVSEENLKRMKSWTKERRIQVITVMMRDLKAPLDTPNILAVVLGDKV